MEDEDEEDARETQSSVIFHYEENEKSSHKVRSCATCDLLYFGEDFSENIDLNLDDIAQQDCHIDTCEFLN